MKKHKPCCNQPCFIYVPILSLFISFFSKLPSYGWGNYILHYLHLCCTIYTYVWKKHLCNLSGILIHFHGFFLSDPVRSQLFLFPHFKRTSHFYIHTWSYLACHPSSTQQTVPEELARFWLLKEGLQWDNKKQRLDCRTRGWAGTEEWKHAHKTIQCKLCKLALIVLHF